MARNLFFGVLGKPFKTKASAKRARKQAILNEKIALSNPKPKAVKKTVTQVYNEYCEFGRAGKAYATIVKQQTGRCIGRISIRRFFCEKFLEISSLIHVTTKMHTKKDNTKI